MQTEQYIYIKKSNINNAGYGIFANKDFEKNEIITQNIFITVEDAPENKISKYYFKTKEPKYKYFVLGSISLVNHSENSNSDPYNFDIDKKICTLFATKSIKKDEEIYFNYGKSYNYTW